MSEPEETEKKEAGTEPEAATQAASDGAGESGGQATGAAHLPSLNFLEPGKLQVTRPGPSRPVRRTVEGDRTYLRGSARAAFPLSDRAHDIEIYDGHDKAIGLIRSVDDLPEAGRAVLQGELDRRYFTPIITGIDRVKREFGFHRFDVDTDRGPKNFLVRSIREDVDLLGDGRYRIKDADGRFYEIPDARELPAMSRYLLDQLF